MQVVEDTYHHMLGLISRKMRETNVGVEELATRMGVSKSQVEALFDPAQDLTLRFLSRVLLALDGDTLEFTTRKVFESGVYAIDHENRR